MIGKQEEMQKALMTKCKALEVCTDRCKGEEDMQCINKCGSQYHKDTHKEFEERLKKYCKEIERMN
jgi:hypothetical protein